MNTKTDDKEVYDGLTDAERAEIAAEEEELAKGASDDDDEGDDGTEGDEGEGGMEAGDVDADSEKGGGTTTVEEAADLRFQPVPLIKGDAPEDAQAKLEALLAQEDELATKFDDGDLTAREYQTQLRALQGEQEKLKTAILRAELSVEITKQEQERLWAADCASFLKEHTDVTASQLRLQSFDTVLRSVTADEDNAKLSNADQLAKAYDQWVKELGIEPKTKAAAKTEKAAKSEEEPPKRREIKTVPTLGGLPASVDNSTEDGKFAYLDRILETKGPVEHEKALRKLSPAEQDEYLRAA